MTISTSGRRAPGNLMAPMNKAAGIPPADAMVEFVEGARGWNGTASTLELPVQTANPVETTIESSFWASSPLQELSLRDNIQRESAYNIPDGILYNCLSSCKSRKNLAARLAAKVFTIEERTTSNSRVLCGKNALDGVKLKAIHDLCIKQFPLERLETKMQ